MEAILAPMLFKIQRMGCAPCLKGQGDVSLQRIMIRL